jgi:hypothetical protein
MPTVYVYSFTGKYTGPSEYKYANPEPGATHMCILFLAQDGEDGRWDEAGSECRKYGFGEYSFARFGKLDVGVLNTDLYRGFSGFYEEALEKGSALLYYPNDKSSAANVGV